MERKSKWTLSSIILAMSLLSISIITIYAFTPFDPGDEFEVLECNQIITDSTIGAISSLDSIDYAACLDSLEDYSGGDKLYKFVVEDTATFAIDFFTLDESTLDLFILNNTVDTAGVDCPGACVEAIIGGGYAELSLMPGIYWIAIDGKASEGVTEEGSYQLAVQCEKEFTEIECGQSILDNTNNRVSNFDVLDYGGCFETLGLTYEEGDKLYKLEINELKTIDIVLEKLDNQGLHLFLLSSAIDITDGSVCPGFCLGKSDTGSISEQITATLPLGIYWLVVESVVSENPDEVGEGNYELSIFCPKDFETIACGDEIQTGTTTGRVSYFDEDDYCLTEFDYSGGDVTYELTLMSDDSIVLEMTPDSELNLDLFLLSSDSVDMKLCPDTCIAVSDTASGVERIKIGLAAGTYYIVVDGASGQEGSFDLEFVCRSLPIELVKFDGKPVQDGIQVKWETATEINFEGFYLQRSENASNWEDLDWIGAKGSPSDPATYEYLDTKPHNGLNFFRLKSMDLDGTSDLSNIIQINYNRAFESVMVYPSTTTDRVTISGMDTKVEIFYEIYSALGQQLGKGTISHKNKTLDVSRFGPGLLYLTLNDGTQVKTFPIQKI
jgi:hypothetical protein